MGGYGLYHKALPASLIKLMNKYEGTILGKTQGFLL